MASDILADMRASLEIDDELLRKAEERASSKGISLQDVVEDALRIHLAVVRPKREGYRLQWRTERGELIPGVSLDSRKALYDLMDNPPT